MPSDLFNERTVEKLSKNIKPTGEQQTIASFWLEEFKSGKLDHEKQTYPLFVSKIMWGVLGYPIEKIPQEKYQADFSYEGPNGEKLLLIEAKDAQTNLTDKQPGRKTTHDTPIRQLADYLMKYEFKYGIATNYHEFILLDRSRSYETYYYFDLKTIKKNPEKLREFIGVFSRESIEGGFVEKIKVESANEEREFTKDFYKLYHETRLMLIKEFEESSQNREQAIHFAQIFLNRFMFTKFAEDTNKLQPRLLENMIWEALATKMRIHEESDFICETIKDLYSRLNSGSKTPIDIFPFNGGLFVPYIPKEYKFKDLRKSTHFKEQQSDSKLHKTKEKTLIETTILSKIDKGVSPITKNILLMASYDFKTQVTVNILGHIFEQSITDLEELQEGEVSKRKKEGVYYTPERITDFICRNTIIPYLSEKNASTTDELIKEYNGKFETLENKLKNLKILDPACGSGAFLIKAVDILLEIHTKILEEKEKSGKLQTTIYSKGGKAEGTYQSWDKTYQENEARDIIDTSIYGVDLNDESVEITKLSLFLKIAQGKRKLLDLNDKIKCGNSLIEDDEIAGPKKGFKWEEHFHEIIKYDKDGKLMDGAGFDIIIGNPPYGAEFTEEHTNYLNEKYSEISSGELESYILFYYRGLSLLKTHGKLGYITPDSWFTNRSCSKYRQYLIANNSVSTVFDWYKPFEDAKDTRCHTVIIDKKDSTDKSIRVEQVLPAEPTRVYRKYRVDPKILKEFGEDEWKFYITPEERKIITKMNLSEKMGEACQIKYGLRTGDNEKFVSENNEKTTGIRLAAGSDIERYNFSWRPKYLIKKDGLSESYFKEEGKKPKIIVQRIRTNSLDLASRWLESTMIEKEYIGLDSTTMIFEKSEQYPLRYVLAVLNSTLMNWYYKLHYTDVNVKPVYLAKLPLPQPKINQIEEIEKRVMLLIDMRKNIKKKKSEFAGRISTKYNIKKIPKKFENLEETGYDELKNEIKKIIKLKMQTSLEEKRFDDYWSGDFEETKKELIELKQKIDQTDHEIDQMVYKLYGLTDEEIRVVEEAVK